MDQLHKRIGHKGKKTLSKCIFFVPWCLRGGKKIFYKMHGVVFTRLALSIISIADLCS